MKTTPKSFFQNPNTGTPMVLTLGETGRVCLFVEGDAPQSAQDTADLQRWLIISDNGLRGSRAFAAMSAQLRLEGADLS